VKKKLVALILSLVCAFTLLGGVAQAAAAANDQPSDWAAEHMAKAREMLLVPDEVDGDFQAPITRAEFCLIAVRIVEVYYDKTIEQIVYNRELDFIRFSDVEYIGTTNNYIMAAAALGITSGTGDNKFSRDLILTREQAATMLRRVLTVIEKDIINPTPAAWVDADKIEGWAREAADVMYAAKIMNGTSVTELVFSPQEAYTREQAIITALNLWNYVCPNWSMPPVSRKYDMSDPNVEKYPEIVEARTMMELQVFNPNGWGSAAWYNSLMKSDNALFDGATYYDIEIAPRQAWVDNYMKENSLSYKDKTDYEKTVIIRRIIEDGSIDDFISIYETTFRYGRDHPIYKQEAVDRLMNAMDFQLIAGIVSRNLDKPVIITYWDGSINAVRFLDADLESGVWNVFLDELDELGCSIGI